MKRIAIGVSKLPVLLVLLSGCYTGEPVENREYVGQDGKSVREASWQHTSGTMWVRHKTDRPKIEDDPYPTSVSNYHTDNTPAQKVQPSQDNSALPRPAVDYVSSKNSTNATVLAASILGDWTVDVDATMGANMLFSDDIQAAIRKGLEINPFDLSITNGVYTSKGKFETMTDKYEFHSIEGDKVTMSLISIDGKKKGEDRKITLSVRKGKLVIHHRDGLRFFMKRPEKNP